ncbi:hypothetical protein ATCV1_z420R [Acanthocystis turfacea chlorella virus 1]|uniref:Uncharacterized protein z420R n=1 Tax=Chlorovirus heliozoae TaxID=322019 RepID=A7K930_9PHYC|nr:hypothetical protein ATCV1_z420R [Acanthocystis turfacea chlorella virus 1]ABT16554.1 hypothetical protein ATCV1_z420R [Acanthocystis turfacea chlorella virus 1]
MLETVSQISRFFVNTLVWAGYIHETKCLCKLSYVYLLPTVFIRLLPVVLHIHSHDPWVFHLRNVVPCVYKNADTLSADGEENVNRNCPTMFRVVFDGVYDCIMLVEIEIRGQGICKEFSKETKCYNCKECVVKVQINTVRK